MEQPAKNQEQANSQGQMQVKVSDEILKGAYANMLQVGHNPEEFVLDFMNLFPPSGVAVARIIVSPGHMKRLAATLVENLKRYEDKFGSIKAAEVPDHKIGFRTE